MENSDLTTTFHHSEGAAEATIPAMSPQQKYLGHQIMAEFYNCPADLLTDHARIEKAMNDAAEACGATIVNSVFHLFNPYGVSGAVIIAESHLAIHTWPEHGYAAVDVFTCGDQVNTAEAISFLAKALQAENYSFNEINRGNIQMLNAQRMVKK